MRFVPTQLERRPMNDAVNTLKFEAWDAREAEHLALLYKLIYDLSQREGGFCKTVLDIRAGLVAVNAIKAEECV